MCYKTKDDANNLLDEYIVTDGEVKCVIVVTYDPYILNNIKGK